jgi:hypothetical protein
MGDVGGANNLWLGNPSQTQQRLAEARKNYPEVWRCLVTQPDLGN